MSKSIEEILAPKAEETGLGFGAFFNGVLNGG